MWRSQESNPIHSLPRRSMREFGALSFHNSAAPFTCGCCVRCGSESTFFCSCYPSPTLLSRRHVQGERFNLIPEPSATPRPVTVAAVFSDSLPPTWPHADGIYHDGREGTHHVVGGALIHRVAPEMILNSRLICSVSSLRALSSGDGTLRISAVAA